MRLYSVAFPSLTSVIVLFLNPSLVKGAGVAFQTGDVVAAVGRGTIKHFSSTGTLLDTLSTGGGESFDTGMTFNTANQLYVTAFDGEAVYKFDSKGNLVGTFGSGYSELPESIVIDNAGNIYVGQVGSTTGSLLKFDSTGHLLASYSPDTLRTDWIDLAAPGTDGKQCILHYTGEGSVVKQFNVCTNTQLPDFAAGLAGPCYAHRIRPNAEELVACAGQVYRLNSSGAVSQTYTVPGSSALFALNLDADNKTFWTGDIGNGNITHIDIVTGTIIAHFNAGALTSLAGVAVVGEITAGNSAPPSTTSYYVTTTRSATLHAMGAALAAQQLTGGMAQDSVVALLFGGPTLVGGVPGVTGLNRCTKSRCVQLPLLDVALLVEAFASGYYNALGTNSLLHVRIVITTNNSPGPAALGGDQVTTAHGQAWAGMVNVVATWIISDGFAGQVDVAGGSDMEPGSNNPTATQAWVDGYASVFPHRLLYNLGDAAGCPTSGATSSPHKCGTASQPDWTQENISYISWGANPSEPLPEIYRTDGTMAAQWATLSLYTDLAHGGPMIIAGALTESQACQQNGCDASLKNTPAEGWQQLFSKLAGDVRTKQDLAWSTDMKWSSH